MSTEGYTVSFLPLDPHMPWNCDAPRHGSANFLASDLFLATLNIEGELFVHQAMYACQECKTIMQGDMEGAHDL